MLGQGGILVRLILALTIAWWLAGIAVAQDTNRPMPGTLAYLDWRYGFRDLKFEQPVDTCKEMVLIEDDDDLKFYNRKGEGPDFNGAKLKTIEYGFYRGKLATVVLVAAGDADAAPLLKALEADYGVGQKSPRNPEKYYWFGKKVLLDYMASPSGPASVGMWSKPLQALQQANKMNKD
jgi:hypothetical protein